MNLGTRVRGAAIAAGVLVLAAGCTTSSADGPTSTAIVSVTASPSVVDPSTFLPSSSVPSPSTSPSTVESSPLAPPSADISPQEAADRAAIEAQWIKFWLVYRDMVGTPAEQRAELVSSVAKSPLAETMLDIAHDANADGIENYGEVAHHLFWEIPVDGQDVAAIGDCQDQTEAGTTNLATGLKSPAGGSKVNIRGQLVRESNGIWLVQTLVDMGTNNC